MAAPRSAEHDEADSHASHGHIMAHGHQIQPWGPSDTDAGSSSLARLNAGYFDKEALGYEDRPGARELARRIGRVIRRAIAFDEYSTTVLDFACGVGMLSRELAPYSKSIVGVDVSKDSVAEYNRRVENQGIAPEEMRAIAVELKGEEGELDNMKFDVAVCSMAYHHFEFPDRVTRLLAHFLKPGGSLFVVDLMSHDPGNGAPVIPEHHHHIVPHRHGFSESDVRTQFEGAGLISFHYGKAFSALIPRKEGLKDSMEDRSVHFFLAYGEKSVV